MSPVALRANPSGGVVVNGGIEIGEAIGGHLQISQTTQRGIINWEDFSISAGELTEFLQPGRDASTLNRVVSGNPSAIQGALRANGKLFVINPNGIMVGAGGSIDVAGLVLSTLDVSDAEYLAGGDMLFRGTSEAGVKNFGRINAIGGDVFLMGKTVENAGAITASGAVGLAAGEEVLITASPDANGERVFVKPTSGVGAGTGINNSGSIEGAAVELKAHGNLYALAINNQGSIRATGASRSGGGVYLRAPGGRVDNSGSIAATLPGGDGGRILIEGAVVNAGGEIDASATTQQGQGGEVTLLGDEISVTGRVAADGGVGGRVMIGDSATSSARVENGAQVSAEGGTGAGGQVLVQGAEVVVGDADISVNGMAAGGEVNVGGGFQGDDAEIFNAINTRVSEAARLSADGLGEAGDGGQVVIWADGRTDFEGRISAEARGSGDGGFVEVSGKRELMFGGMVSTLSAGGGQNGTLLLDPTNFNITVGAAPGAVNGIGDVTLEGLLGANHVIIATDAAGVEAGDITVESGADVTWNNGNALTMLAHGDILLNADVQNGGTGGVHLIAGWDDGVNAPGSPGASVPGTVITAADFASSEYGLGNGSVVIGDGAQTSAIRVGSRGGATTVAADGLTLNGSTASAGGAAHLGFFADGASPITGSIDLYLKDGGLSLNGGGTGAHAQIGHGGMGAVDGAAIDAPITITFAEPGAVTLLGGSDVDAYAQIGHGGRAYASNGLEGGIAITGAGSSLVSGGSSGGAYAQIGHGGRGASDGTGIFGGSLSFSTVNDADLTVRGTQSAGALAEGRWAYGQIGHGGASARGDATGSIDLSIAGGLTVLGGRLIDSTASHAQNYAQVGHGGWDGDGAHTGDVSVDVNGGNLEIRAGLSRESYAQIGHGGRNEDVGDNSGVIEVDITSGSLNLIGGNGGGGGEFAYAQLGHGGGLATGSHSGDITVSASNEVTLLQGARDGAYKLIGHGGQQAPGSHSGEIQVSAVNDIRLVGGINDLSFAQIGHGGYVSPGDLNAPVIGVTSTQGAIEVTGGNLGSSSNDGRFGYAQIGLGGYGSDGNHSAEINVQAEDGITIRGGSRDHNYALIGNGGNLSDGTKTGEISVTTTTGNILIAAAANHELSPAQIGHGGFRATGAASGRITVETGAGELTLRNGGGDDNDAPPTFTTGEFSYSYAQIGHGGAQGGNFSRTGDISVQVTGDVSLDAGFAPGVRAYTQVGHGGYDAGGDFSGLIDLETSGGGISLESGGQEGQYAKVGHGGFDSPGQMEGAITLTAGGGGVSAVAGAGDNALAQIGHGGIFSAGEKSGAITVDAEAGGIELSGGSGALALAQIGHGGYQVAGSVTGLVDLSATGDISVLGGAGQTAYALVGHGGLHATGLHDGAITVNTEGAITISGGGTPGDGVEGSDNFGQIGHSLQGAAAGFGQFVEINGQVVIEAEGYTTNPSGLWVVVPTFADPTPGPGPFLNARGEVYLQLPNGSGSGSAAGTGREVTYQVQIDTAGTYRIYPRWTGYDGGSDSMWIDVVELKDGVGGTVPDWYEFQEGGFSNFNSPAWSTTGGFEANNFNASPRQPVLIDIPSPGLYTIRMNAREDGLGLDAIALLPEAAAAPTGLGPAPTYSQRSGALGAVTVNAGGNIAISGGINSGSHGAIGHGGSQIDNLAGRVSYGSAASAADITVRSSAGNILLSGGSNDADSGLPSGRYAAIGHHGSQSEFDAFGDVVVEGGNFTLTGGANNGSSARIGHGGDGASAFSLNDAEGPATFSGAVEVMAANAIALLGGSALAGGTTGGGAQLGHGGIQDGLTLVEIDGKICVVAGDGVILNAANGSGEGAYTQIGHGGVNLVGAKSGKIAVTSGVTGTGGVVLTGGSVGNAYAQIGHGGVDSSGDMSGDLSVVADNGGAIALQGGTSASNYAMTGHGDGGGVTTTGTRQGGVRLFGDGGLSAIDGGVANTSVFHQTNGGLDAADYLGGNGFQLVGNGTVSFSDGALNGVNTMADGNFGTGPVSFAFSNDIDIVIGAGQDRLVDTSDHFLMATGGSITMLSSYQNAGDGAVTLVAGWDGTGSFSGGSVSFNGGDFCDPLISAPDSGIDFNNCDRFGNNGAMLVIGDSDQAAAVRIGSRSGATILAGSGLTMEAGTSIADSSTQVGFYGDGSGPASGAISLFLHGGGLSMASGTTGSFTQIGHGGMGSVGAAIDAPVTISFCEPGDLTLNGGPGEDAYAQIGHGGRGVTGTRAGDIQIIGSNGGTAGAIALNGGSGTHAYTQIGHGGLATSGGSGATRGSIRIESNAAVDLTGGAGQDAYSQIGLGGHDNNASHGAAGDRIVVIADEGISLIGGDTAGSGYGAYAQIGQGGYDADGTLTGDIYLNYDPDAAGGAGAAAGGGNIVLLASTKGTNENNFGTVAQIGHGGRNMEGVKIGDIVIGAADDVSVTGALNHSYAQIGHGGNGSVVNGAGNATGEIRIAAGGDLTVQGGGGTGGAYGQIGHGGHQYSGQLTGGIDLSFGGGAEVLGGSATQAYSQIGHGGYQFDGTVTGNVALSLGGGVEVLGGIATDGYAQIGHGGAIASGEVADSAISVDAGGNIELVAGAAVGQRAYAQIGHGGYQALEFTAMDSDILINTAPGSGAGAVLVQGGGVNAHAQIGHGGARTDSTRGQGDSSASGDILIGASSSVTLQGGNNTDGYAQIGHGGEGLAGSHSGNIEVRSAGDISLTGGGGVSTRQLAMIGHGGFASSAANNAGAKSGAITLDADGNITLVGGTGTQSSAQVGHGGDGSGVDLSGAITLASGADITLQSASSGYSQIGHGGSSSGGSSVTDSTIQVDAVGAIDLRGSNTGTFFYAQIGHGGANSNAMNVTNSDILVNTLAGSGTGDLTLRAGTGSNAHVQIGHGGSRSDGSGGFGDREGDIVVGAAANIALLGSTNTDSYAQIGHGGEGGNRIGSGATLLGDIELTTSGDLEIVAGGGTDAYAQIGHGGENGAVNRADGDITLTVGGETTLSGGTVTRGYAQIGHGGSRVTGDGGASLLTGEISLNHDPAALAAIGGGGDIVLAGGAGSFSSAQIGHGGISFSGDVTGDINLVAGGASSLSSGNHVDSYALVGHGGAGSTGSFTGEICFHSTGGLSLDSSGSSYTQIGHGGRDAIVGSLSGTISVTALGDVSVSGGGSANAYAQVGHGGINTDAPMSGDLYVIADNGGDLTISGGSGTNAYAMLGHGDGVGTIGVEDSGTSGGTRQGGIQYFAGGDLTVTHGSGGNSYLHHRTNTGGGLDFPTTYLGGSGYQIVSNGTSSIASGALEGQAAMINGNIGVGHIVVSIQDDIDFTYSGPDVFFDNDFDFIILTGGDIEMLATYQNAGRGRGVLVAGWDGVITSPAVVDLTDLCAPVIQPGTIDFNNCDAFGNNGGTVTLGSAGQDEAVRFGSREGLTAVAGHGVVLNASTGTEGAGTQVGFYGDGSGAITGEILVRAKAGGLTMNSGTTSAYTQIGHGGLGSTGAGIDAPITISFCEPGDLTLNAGTGQDAYAQIGHGGRGVSGTRAGDIEISEVNGNGVGRVALNGGSGTHAYTQIGHGGLATSGGSGTTRGSIRLESNAAVELTGGAGQDAYSQIGLGGHDNNANHGAAGDRIVVIADEGISLTGGDTAGTTFGAYAQIGQGGYDADGVLRGDIFLNFDPVGGTAAGGGDITLLGSTKATAENNFGTVAMIGHGGRNQTGAKFGDIVIGAAEDVSVIGGQTLSFAQIGHGGNDSGTGANGDVEGSIRIDAGGDLTVSGGPGNDAYGQIGHGGYRNSGGTEGEIELSIDGNLALTGGTGLRSYGQIGSGGAESGNSGSGVRTGNTLVEIGGALEVGGGSGTDAYAHIGHGGRNAASGLVIDGGIEVNAVGDVRVAAGSGTGTYAQIGQGGYIATNGQGTYTGATVVRSSGGGIELDALAGGAGGNAYTQIGHGGLVKGEGTMSGATTVEAGGALVLRGGDGGSNRYAQIGHGGAGADGDKLDADVTVSADSLFMKAGSGSAAYAQIGAGGSASGGDNAMTGNISGEVNVTTTGGGITMEGTGAGSRNYVQIGFGGGNINNANIGAGNSVDGAINVASAGDLTLDASSAYYAQIGHGGRRIAADSLGGEIRVSADGDLVLLGGIADRRYAQIGHGGTDSTSAVAGSDIQVDATGAISLTADAGQAYSQIGHGGYEAINFTVADSAILVNTAAGSGGGDIALTGGSGSNAPAMIGHGGARTDGNRGLGDNSASGDITVGNAADIILNAGSTTNAFAQIGHGGEGGVGTHSGEIALGATGDLRVLAGTGGNAATAQVGHGGVNSPADLSGGIGIDVGGDVEVSGGAANQAHAQIGHGGHSGSGATRDGNILVEAGGAVDLIAGGGTDAHAQIGHGGRNGSGDVLDASVTVLAGGPVNLTAGQGPGLQSFAQIGHGGVTSPANYVGAVTVQSGGNLTMLGGTTQNGVAHIGHGGRLADGNHGGDITVTAEGSINATGGPGQRAFVMIGHGGSQPTGGTLDGDIIVAATGGSVVFTAGTGEDGQARIGHGGPDNPGAIDGDIAVSGSEGIELNAGSAGTRNLAQIGHGGGAVTGDLSGDIFLNINPATSAPSGGGDIRLNGGAGTGGAYAQVGHGGLNASGNASGAVAGFASGAIVLNGGGVTDSYAHFGHGGREFTGDLGGSGDGIVAIAMNGIELNSGTGLRAYSQIGHGGHGSGGEMQSSIFVNFDPVSGSPFGGGAISLRGGGADAYSRIGHGGIGVTGHAAGDITLEASGDLDLLAGAEEGAYAQIGHGGKNSPGNREGDFAVNVAGNASLSGGAADDAYSLIGHGGVFSDGFLEGDIDLDIGGNLDLVGGTVGERTFAMIGHSLYGARGGFGGLLERNGIIVGEAEFFDSTDTWVVLPEGTLPIWTGGTPPQSFLDNGFTGSRNGFFIHMPEGNGGGQASNNNFALYTFTTTTGGSYRLSTRWTGFNGNSDSLFADIVELKDGIGSGEADFYQFAGGTSGNGVLEWQSVATTEASTGGTGSDQAVWNLDPNTTYTLRINPREDGVAVDAWMLGLNGATPSGEPGVTFANISGIAGEIDVRATGDIALESGADDNSYVAIGHGGSDIENVAGRIGYGSTTEMAIISVTSTGGDILLNGASGGGGLSGRYTSIGHHGSNTSFDAFGEVVVSAETGDLILNGGVGEGSQAQIGHGGRRDSSQSSGDPIGEFSGNVRASAGGDIALNSQTGWTQIGHGGSEKAARVLGDLEIVANGALSLNGGAADGAFAHVGHGGDGGRGSNEGNFSINAGDGFSLHGGTQPGAFAQVGHGGRAHQGFGEGAITLNTSAGDIALTGGADGGYALLGHGGESIAGYALEGDLSATAENGSVLLNGGADEAFAQIGHGGRRAGGPKFGRVEVSASNDVSLTAGGGDEAFAQIGLGGSDSDGADLGATDDATVVVAGGDVILRASDTGQSASAMIGHGGVSSGALRNQGMVMVDAGGDLDLTGGAADFAMAQVGNGGLGAGGEIRGDVFVQAENVSVNRGLGLHSYGKVGNGDHYLDSPVGAVGDSGSVGGDIQVLARQDISLQGGMIGGLDPTLNHRSTAAAGDTFLAVSRNDPSATGTGNLIGDTDSVLAAGAGGELRLYLPARANNQLASGVNLNGTDYPGANVDPMNQQIDELVIHQIDEDGVEVLTPNEHQNLINGELNFIAGIVSPETANYSDVLGNYSLYYDTITVVEAGPPVIPEEPGDGGAGGSAGGSAGGGPGTGGGELPGEGGGEEPEVPTPTVVVVTGPDGTQQVIEVTTTDDGAFPLFLTLPDGTVGFSPGRLGAGSSFVPVGFLLENLLDDHLLDDQHEAVMTYRGPQHPWENGGESDFTIEYQPSNLPGWSSFNVIGDPPSIGTVFTPVSPDSDLNPSLRAYLEGLEIQSAELEAGAE